MAKNKTPPIIITGEVFQNQEKEIDNLNLDQILEANFQRFGVSYKDGYTFETLSKIAEICDISGSLKRNYYEIDVFFENQITKLQGSLIDTENNLTAHLKLLYLVSYIYFKTMSYDYIGTISQDQWNPLAG